MSYITALLAQIKNQAADIHFDRLLNFYFISMFVLLLSLGISVFYFQRKTVIALIALYFAILISVLVPFELYVLRATELVYSPLISFLVLYGVLIFVCSMVFSGKRLIRQEFSRPALLAVSCAFVGLLVSSIAFLAPDPIIKYGLRDLSWIFAGPQVRTIWILISMVVLVFAAMWSRRR